MSLNIDMKIVRPWNCSGSPILLMNFWTSRTSSIVVNPGKYSTRIPSVLRLLCPKFCIVMNLWTNPTAVPKQYLMLGSDSLFQDITQNLKIRKPLHARDWWLLHHWPEIVVSMDNFPSWFETDASNVEDINILQIIERWSMSCIVSSRQRSKVFRNRSFTLFKNNRDLSERFDSVAVSESISSSMTNSSYTGLSVLVFAISPDFHAWEAHLKSSEVRPDFQIWFSRACRCSRGKHVRVPRTVSWYQIHHRLWFCCDSFFTYIFFSFRHRFRTIDGTEMADVEQTQKMIPFITCDISLCQYVVDLGVQIDSIKQPIKSNSGFRKRVSLYGFFPWWSSWSLLRCLHKCTTKLPHEKNSRLRGHCLDHQSFHEFSFALEMYTGLPALDHSDACFREELWRSEPINQVRVYRPSFILHPRKWFLILLNCAKLKIVSYTSNWLEQTYGFRKCTMFHLK